MLVLLVPTMIWVRLRVPGRARLVEFLCLLPLTIPPLVIVVGIANVYAWVTYLFGDSALTLTFVVRRPGAALLLPRDRRARCPSINVDDPRRGGPLARRRLGDGHRRGSSLPNIWPGVTSAAFVTVALVLGEYTFASLLNFRHPARTCIAALGKSDAPTSVAASLAALIFALVLLLVAALPARPRRRSAKGGLT